MEATDYLSNHWGPRQVWKHLDWPKHRRRLELCARLCEGRTAVDVGCAYGHSMVIMAGRRPEIEWSGIEFDAEAVRLARETYFPPYAERLIYVPSVAELSRLAQRWDSAVCSEVIEHVEDPAALAAGLRAIVLRRAVLTTPASRVNDPGHLRVFAMTTLMSTLKPYFRQVSASVDGPFLVAVAEV